MMKRKQSFYSGKIAYLGLFSALAVLMGYVEFLLPTGIGIPGFKLGLCNIVLVPVLYIYGLPSAFLVSVVRILINGFLFGNLYSIAYSLSGTVCALSVMALLKKTGMFSLVGTSSAGGAMHNTGQLACAVLMIPGIPFAEYFPVLLVLGCISGLFTGLLSYAVLTRLPVWPYAEDNQKR